MTQNTAAELRLRLKSARKHLAVADRQRGSLLIRARLYSWLAIMRDQKKAHGLPPPQTIAFYWPLTDEPDLGPLITQWAEAGLNLALPKIMAPAQPLQFFPWQLDSTLIEGPFGVLEPPVSADSTAVIPDVVLVPTLGFTTAGDRLGHGKGFYDRTLAHLNAQGHHPLTIGVAWDVGAIDELVPDYKPQPHDKPLNAIITPSAWYPAPPSDPSDGLDLQALPNGHGG